MIWRRPLKIKKRKKIYQHPLFWKLCFLFSLAIFLFNLFFLSPFFDIKKIEIEGGELTNLSLLANEILILTHQKTLFLPSKVEKEVLTKFFEIEKIKILIFPQKVVVKIQEKKPKINFCFEENCFLVSSEGVLFKKGKDEKLLTLERPGVSLKLGEKVLEGKELEKVLQLSEKLKEFRIEKIEYQEPQKVVFKIEGTDVYFSLEKDLNWQVTKFKTLLEKEFSKEELKSLEYIDVRFGNFANFKFKNQ